MTTTQTAALVAEIERLNECLRYEQHRANRRGTHSAECWKFGPEHYECAMRQVERLTRELAEANRCRCPDLLPVINWIDNGCDPKEAVKELRIYQQKYDAAMQRTDAGATSPTTR